MESHCWPHKTGRCELSRRLVYFLVRHQAYHEKTKHIDVRLHFIREMIEDKEIQVLKVGTENNPADMLTKSLPRVKFKHCLDLINFCKG
jgi:hypothetical protein